MVFDGWDSIQRMVVFGTVAYVCTIVMLRISGSRTLSKMNAFDLVVTVAFGSTLSAVFINGDLSLVTGVAALVTLVVLQYVVASLKVRSVWFSKAVTSQPVLLAWQGKTLGEAMKKERVTHADILAALREKGHADLDRVLAVVLEADGGLAVIDSTEPGQRQALSNVELPSD